MHGIKQQTVLSQLVEAFVERVAGGAGVVRSVCQVVVLLMQLA